MKSVILFGGGDGGGLIITDKGVRPIPPFDPAILLTLKSTASLVMAGYKSKEKRTRSRLLRLANGLSNLAVEQVEQVVGPLSGNNALVFQDVDGGFTCGSTGKPPIPLPWPPTVIPSVPELLESGAIGEDLVHFIEEVMNKKMKLSLAFENPAKIAKALEVPLSDQSIKDLRVLAPSKVKNIKNPAEREVVRFFHKVIADGRFMDVWLVRPYEVAQELNVRLSEEALGILAGGGTSGGIYADGAIAAGIVWAGVCIVVGILLGMERPIDQIIIDRSGLVKY